MLVNRVRKNRKQLRKWSAREGVSCYRLYDKDIPEIPLAVDWYDGRLHVAEYKVKRESPDGWAEELAAGLGEALEVPAEWVYVKSRQRQRGKEQYERVDDSGNRFQVEEGGHRFWVNLGDYLDTGLFLDHRPTRARVESEAGGKDVLNLFCYTGAFTVYAAAGGARSTLSIDLSKTYTAWAQDNLALNDLAGPSHRVQQHDVLAWLAAKAKAEFDIVILDPPTFSNSKRMDKTFDVQRDHPWLLERTIARLRPGGICYFSTNFRRFKLADDIALGDAVVEDISDESVPPDFRNRRIHRCYRITRPA
jgi:23S rRNA G2069 N7-methylase RlmK/C1962 C5-methylase RlmI